MASPSSVLAQLAAGYNGGNWGGASGITSSVAAGDVNHVMGIRYTVSGTSFTLQVAKFGDANGNGRIDADDYATIDRARAKGLTGWVNGDFNYDGTVNAGDYLLIDRSLVVQSGYGPSASLLAEREAEFGPGYVAALVASIPEPGMAIVALVGLGWATDSSRRRGRQGWMTVGRP